MSHSIYKEMMQHLKMSANHVATLYLNVSASLTTQILYMTNASTIKCDNCGEYIYPDQSKIDIQERLRMAHYHSEYTGCVESTDRRRQVRA